MGYWNSSYLEVLYYVLGWIAFCAWAICFYPQVILNFRRKSVVGLNFDFAVLNLTKHTCYLVYNASLFFSSTVQRQYRQKFGFDQMIPVAANDVAFSIHAVLLTVLTLCQIAIYDRGNQKVSKASIAIILTALFSAAVCVFVAMPSHSWLWLVSCFNTLQVVMTTIKYIPQAVFNFRRKSTIGFSIGYILLDFVGSTTSFFQMTVESIDQRSWMNFYGNIGKIMLSVVSLFFDILFMLQHFVLYPSKSSVISPTTNAEDKASLLETSDHHPHPDDEIHKWGRGIQFIWRCYTMFWDGLHLPHGPSVSTLNVVGLNFDFLMLNLTKHSSYLIYNASLFFSSAVQRQYRKKYGLDEMIPVAANDVAFSIHAVLLTAFTLFQVVIYDRGNQKVSRPCIAIVSVAWLSAAICVFVALPRHSWLWLVSCFSTIQVVMTVIKYIPQAILNFQRKSTVGFSIGNILLDFLGGVTNYCQMAVQSIDQNSWVNFYGNIGKTLISLVSIFFDILFMVQHYVLYPSKKTATSPTPDVVTEEQSRDIEAR
ncbi:Cystinosin-like protein [Abeliophyllum distichum]|uniref:Cystinosin homolog n=1 Tax=Abeliophyllum distichum TaxID=126358 RepID=A0ABD1SHF0_9LAMI